MLLTNSKLEFYKDGHLTKPLDLSFFNDLLEVEDLGILFDGYKYFKFVNYDALKQERAVYVIGVLEN